MIEYLIVLLGFIIGMLTRQALTRVANERAAKRKAKKGATKRLNI